MKILYLTFYFEPDLSAGSFRNTVLAKELARRAQGRASIHVITTQPNRYSTFHQKAAAHEEQENLIIDRVSIPAHRNRFLDQVMSYRAYYARVKKIASKQKYDLVFVSSSRLFSSYLGMELAKKNKCPLYLDIRDLFVENMREILRNRAVAYPLSFFLKWVERRSFSYASHINLVSEGFIPNFKDYTQAKYTCYPNGIDNAFLQVEQVPGLGEFPKVITYAGNIGEGQGLDKIIPDVAERLNGKYIFRVIGDGGTKAKLEAAIAERKLKNVEIVNPIKRDELIEYYKSSHFLFMHLNEYKAFEKVLPSKLFEYGATDIPVIAGVGGYAREFLSQHMPNALVFDPCDSQSMLKLLESYNYHTEKRREFVAKFTRDIITKKMTESILSYLPTTPSTS